jgi:ABC-2 type transport system permease protein
MSTINAELRSRRNDSKEARSSWLIIAKIASKHIRLILQYKMDIIYWILMPLLWLIPWIFMAQSLLGSSGSAQFESYTGSDDYIGFLLIGSMLWATIDAALWGAGNALRWEQQSGTLEYLWISPVARTDILTGASIGEVGWVFTNVIGQFLIIATLFDWVLEPMQLLVSFLAVIIMFIGMLGFGFLFASIIMVFKEPGVLTELVDNFMFIVSPVRYPIQSLPIVLRFISVVLPFTWGASIIRDLLIAQKSILSVLGSFGFLLLVDLVLWVVGYWLFNKVEHRTRKSGRLGEF